MIGLLSVTWFFKVKDNSVVMSRIGIDVHAVRVSQQYLDLKISTDFNVIDFTCF